MCRRQHFSHSVAATRAAQRAGEAAPVAWGGAPRGAGGARQQKWGIARGQATAAAPRPGTPHGTAFLDHTLRFKASLRAVSARALSSFPQAAGPGQQGETCRSQPAGSAPWGESHPPRLCSLDSDSMRRGRGIRRGALLLCSRERSWPCVAADARVARCPGRALRIPSLLFSSLPLADPLPGPVCVGRVLCRAQPPVQDAFRRLPGCSARGGSQQNNGRGAKGTRLVLGRAGAER